MELNRCCLQVLYTRGFPVPQPIDFSRHCLVMQLVDGFPLCHVTAIDEPGTLFARLMAILVQFAEHGLIHGDFNEFNLMVSPVSKGQSRCAERSSSPGCLWLGGQGDCH